MLSYRHAFHAGNHADVLKHLTLMLIIEYMTGKDKGLLYLDTHAGSGQYSLNSHYANRTLEFKSGIEAIWNQSDLPDPLSRFVSLILSFNSDSRLNTYPGSPTIAARLLRHQDRLQLFEKHNSDYPELKKKFCTDKRVKIRNTDGFNALKSELPPLSRRGIILIDPSYETTKDYRSVISGIRMGLNRFIQGVYVVWFPVINKSESRQLPKKLMALPTQSHLSVTLHIRSKSEGMTGSGLVVLNPPFILKSELEKSLPTLTRLLGQDSSAHFELNYLETQDT